MSANKIPYDKLIDILALQTMVVQAGNDLGAIMDLVARNSQKLTEADGASVELIEGDELVYSAVSGIAAPHLGLRLAKAGSLSGTCLIERTALYSPDIETDDRVNKDACRRLGLTSMIVHPLYCQDKPVGVLKVLSAKAYHFDDTALQVLSHMSALVAAAMFHAMSNGESELLRQATHDPLTGIPNRAHVYDKLRRQMNAATQSMTSFAVVSMDMDGLKHINDTYGHRAGDAALCEVTVRATRSLRSTDTVARLGGDEFGLILTHVPDRHMVHELLQRLQATIERPFRFDGKDLSLRASLGFALYREDGVDLDVLMEHADQAMYESKRVRKGSAPR